jgi:hypothetical protein
MVLLKEEGFLRKHKKYFDLKVSMHFLPKRRKELLLLSHVE